MSLLHDVLNNLSRRLAERALRIELRHAHPDVLRYRDCLETVRALMKLHRPRHLLDVGAHYGRWAWVLSQLHPGLQSAVLVEPQAQCQATLRDLDLGGAAKTLFACAAGAAPGERELTGGGASASLLPAAEAQRSYFPGSVTAAAERVELCTLDALYAGNALPRPDLVKLDVQGGELEAMKGGRDVLAGARCVVIELSLRRFYEDQPALAEVLGFLGEAGFTLAGRGYEWRAAANPAELLQFDGIFLREGA